PGNTAIRARRLAPEHAGGRPDRFAGGDRVHVRTVHVGDGRGARSRGQRPSRDAHAVWEPELPLAEGKYTLNWITPAITLMNEPLPFVVMGDPERGTAGRVR